MKNTDYEKIKIQYEQERKNAINDLEDRKNKLYKSIPRLAEIEDEINKISINKTKNILLHSLTSNLRTNYENQLINLKNEKSQLLKKLNISDEFFQPKFQCNRCKDTGYITYNNKKTQMCSCLKQKLINISYNQSNLNNLQKENFKNFDLNKFSNEININKYKMNVSPRTNINKIKNASINFVNNFNNEKTKNLFFTGNTGLRKNLYDKLYCQ